jgi:hypothetical protein
VPKVKKEEKELSAAEYTKRVYASFGVASLEQLFFALETVPGYAGTAHTEPCTLCGKGTMHSLYGHRLCALCLSEVRDKK